MNKFECWKREKEVDHNDCLNCIYWDECEQRPQGNVVGLSLLMSAAITLVLTLYAILAYGVN